MSFSSLHNRPPVLSRPARPAVLLTHPLQRRKPGPDLSRHLKLCKKALYCNWITRHILARNYRIPGETGGGGGMVEGLNKPTWYELIPEALLNMAYN